MKIEFDTDNLSLYEIKKIMGFLQDAVFFTVSCEEEQYKPMFYIDDILCKSKPDGCGGDIRSIILKCKAYHKQ